MQRSFSQAVMRTGVPFLVTTLFAVSGCAHECPRHGPPDMSWAEQLACYDHAELDDRAPTGRAGCYRLALGPSYLMNAFTGTEHPFNDSPEFLELTSEQHTTGIRS